MANSTKGKKIIPWTKKEDERLLKNVSNNVTCLKKAFLLTSQETQRTPGACAYRWYNHVSKTGPTEILTVSKKHFAVNRKNSKGVKSNISLFRKILIVLGLKK